MAAGSDTTNKDDGYITFWTSAANDNAERVRINSSGQLIQRYSADPYNNRAATFQSGAGVDSTYIAVVNTETNGASGVLFGDHAGQDAGNYTGYIQYLHQTNDMKFFANGGVERFKIGSGGDATVTDGNLVIGTGGHGIDFSAQTATSASGASTNSSTNAEILDHYERGTFTPDFQIGGVSNSLSGANYHGNYTRIGNLLYICCYYYKSSGSNNNAGYWRLYGLPFSIEDSIGGAYQSISGGYTNINGTSYDTGSDKHIRWQANGSNYLSLYADFNDVTWTSGACEFQITGVLKIHD